MGVTMDYRQIEKLKTTHRRITHTLVYIPSDILGSCGSFPLLGCCFTSVKVTVPTAWACSCILADLTHPAELYWRLHHSAACRISSNTCWFSPLQNPQWLCLLWIKSWRPTPPCKTFCSAERISPLPCFSLMMIPNELVIITNYANSLQTLICEKYLSRPDTRPPSPPYSTFTCWRRTSSWCRMNSTVPPRRTAPPISNICGRSWYPYASPLSLPSPSWRWSNAGIPMCGPDWLPMIKLLSGIQWYPGNPWKRLRTREHSGHDGRRMWWSPFRWSSIPGIPHHGRRVQRRYKGDEYNAQKDRR